MMFAELRQNPKGGLVANSRTRDVFAKKRITSWPQLVQTELEYANRKASEWVFRGQSNPRWQVESSLERVFENLGVDPKRVGSRLEKSLTLEFSRNYHSHGLPFLPKEGDLMEWLALMRHHGGPVRFVDFSFSFFVAAYFALEGAQANGDSVVWAINKKWLSDHFDLQVGRVEQSQSPTNQKRFKKKGGLLQMWRDRDPEAFDLIFMNQNPPLSLVGPVNPARLNQRLSIQQGLFLCPADITKTFQQNLLGVPEARKQGSVIRFVIAGEQRRNILRRLYRAGINRAALFPGLDGLAQSLNTRALLQVDLIEGAQTGKRQPGNLAFPAR